MDGHVFLNINKFPIPTVLRFMMVEYVFFEMEESVLLSSYESWLFRVNYGEIQAQR